jgi:hypothetical protein
LHLEYNLDMCMEQHLVYLEVHMEPGLAGDDQASLDISILIRCTWRFTLCTSNSTLCGGGTLNTGWMEVLEMEWLSTGWKRTSCNGSQQVGCDPVGLALGCLVKIPRGWCGNGQR